MTQGTSALVPGMTFERYAIVRLLGQGGMGYVYEAIHPTLKKRVAIKVLNTAVAQSSDSMARFLREGEVSVRINHPHVVDVTDVGIHDGIPFIVMEFLEGEDLGTHLAR